MRNVCELIYDFMIYVLLQSHVKYLDLLQYNAGFSMQCFAAICTMVTSNSVTKEESLSSRMLLRIYSSLWWLRTTKVEWYGGGHLDHRSSGEGEPFHFHPKVDWSNNLVRGQD